MGKVGDVGRDAPVMAEARGWPLLGKLPSLLRNLPKGLQSLRNTYGMGVRFLIAGARAYLISDPEGVKEVLTAGEGRFPKGALTAAMRAAFGNGLALAEGEEWRRKRKLLQPLFATAAAKRWQPIINSRITELVGQWRKAAASDDIVRIDKECTRLIQRIMTDIMFGDRLPDTLAREARGATHAVNDGLMGEFYRSFVLIGPLKGMVTPGRKKFYQSVKRLHDVIDASISYSQEHDLHLMAEFRRVRNAETGDTLSNDEIRDEVLAFFFAGLETTSSALSWALYYLALYPSIAEKVAKEARSVLGFGLPDTENLKNLIYTRQVVNETLRLRAPAYAMERRVGEEPVVLGGCPMSKDALVIIAPYVTHLDSATWPEAEKFDPERFSEKAVRGRHPFAFIPFGGGARKCIGMPLAMMELVTAVAIIARDFEFEYAGRKPLRHKAGVTLRPLGSIPIRLSLRENSDRRAEVEHKG